MQYVHTVHPVRRFRKFVHVLVIYKAYYRGQRRGRCIDSGGPLDNSRFSGSMVSVVLISSLLRKVSPRDDGLVMAQYLDFLAHGVKELNFRISPAFLDFLSVARG